MEELWFRGREVYSGWRGDPLVQYQNRGWPIANVVILRRQGTNFIYSTALRCVRVVVLLIDVILYIRTIYSCKDPHGDQWQFGSSKRNVILEFDHLPHCLPLISSICHSYLSGRPPHLLHSEVPSFISLGHSSVVGTSSRGSSTPSTSRNIFL